MSSLARFKFIKTKNIFRYHTKGLSNQVSSNLDHEIESYIGSSNSSTKIGKNEIMRKIFWVTNQGNKRIPNRGRFYGLQIGARGITNRVSFRDF